MCIVLCEVAFSAVAKQYFFLYSNVLSECVENVHDHLGQAEGLIQSELYLKINGVCREAVELFLVIKIGKLFCTH